MSFTFAMEHLKCSEGSVESSLDSDVAVAGKGSSRGKLLEYALGRCFQKTSLCRYSEASCSSSRVYTYWGQVVHSVVVVFLLVLLDRPILSYPALL